MNQEVLAAKSYRLHKPASNFPPCLSPYVAGKHFGCRICGRIFVKLDKLIEHGFKHTRDGYKSCAFCGQQYQSGISLSIHQMVSNWEQSIERINMASAVSDSDSGSPSLQDQEKDNLSAELEHQNDFLCPSCGMMPPKISVEGKVNHRVFVCPKQRKAEQFHVQKIRRLAESGGFKPLDVVRLELESWLLSEMIKNCESDCKVFATLGGQFHVRKAAQGRNGHSTEEGANNDPTGYEFELGIDNDWSGGGQYLAGDEYSGNFACDSNQALNKPNGNVDFDDGIFSVGEEYPSIQEWAAAINEPGTLQSAQDLEQKQNDFLSVYELWANSINRKVPEASEELFCKLDQQTVMALKIPRKLLERQYLFTFYGDEDEAHEKSDVMESLKNVDPDTLEQLEMELVDMEHSDRSSNSEESQILAALKQFEDCDINALVIEANQLATETNDACASCSF